MLTWIAENKEWAFSGVGVAALSGLVAWVHARRSKTIDAPDVIKQNQRGGDQSTNIQIGKVERTDD